MNAAICRERSLIAAKPYLTKDSQFALELTQIFIPLAEAVAGQELQDAYAKGCRYPPKVIDQLQVNAHRYLIRYVDADGEKEAVVVLENGKWKIRLK